MATRSGCAQCRETSIECTWPAQKKRYAKIHAPFATRRTDDYSSGPAKGYIEGLEHRLHEAEQLLLQILPLVSTDQLTEIVMPTEHAGLPGQAGSRLTPPSLNKKTGVEYWEQFPLDSVESIRTWQQDCTMGHRDSLPSLTLPEHPNLFQNTTGIEEQTHGNFSMTSTGKLNQPRHSSLSPGLHSFHGVAPDQSWSGMYECPPTTGPVTTSMAVDDVSTEEWGHQRKTDRSQPTFQSEQTTNDHPTESQQQSVDSSFFNTDTQRHYFW